MWQHANPSRTARALYTRYRLAICTWSTAMARIGHWLSTTLSTRFGYAMKQSTPGRRHATPVTPHLSVRTLFPSQSTSPGPMSVDQVTPSRTLSPLASSPSWLRALARPKQPPIQYTIVLPHTWHRALLRGDFASYDARASAELAQWLSWLSRTYGPHWAFVGVLPQPPYTTAYHDAWIIPTLKGPQLCSTYLIQQTQPTNTTDTHR